MIGEYFGQLEELLGSFPLVVSVETETERVDLDRGYVKGTVTFADDPELHLFEYVVIEESRLEREDYRYHYQTSEGALIRRWDTAPHHRDVATFPYHLHVGDDVQSSEPMTPEAVLGEIARLLRSGGDGEGSKP